MLTPAVRAAADNDLYRICGTSPAQWRTRDGQWIYHVHVDYAVARGLLGQFVQRQMPGTEVKVYKWATDRYQLQETVTAGKESRS